MSGGRWEPVVTQVWETNVTPCDCCGRVVARRLWVASLEGGDKAFCGPECEELYRTYVLPKKRGGA